MRLLITAVLCLFSLSYSLTLQEAVKIALKNNLDIKNQEINETISNEKAKEVKSTRFGKLDLFANYTYYESKRIVTPISIPVSISKLKGSRDIFIPGIRYTVPIFRGFKIKRNIEISNLGEKLEKLKTDLTKNEIVFNVRSIYLKILSLQKQLNAMRNYKKALNKLYQDVYNAYKLGKKPEVDLLKVEYQKENLNSIVKQLENNIDTLKKVLQTLLNTDEKIEVEDIKLRTIDKNYSVNNLLKTYFPKLYSYKQLEIREKIQKKKVYTAKSEYFPYLYLSGIYQRNIGGSVNQEVWQIALTGTYTLFDFGKRKHRLLKEKLALSQIKIQEQKLLLNKEKQLTDALNQIKTADFKIKATKKQLNYSNQVEKIEKLKYEEGVSSLYDYLYAKSQKYIAQSKYYEALYDKQRAIYYLDYVLEKGFK